MTEILTPDLLELSIGTILSLVFLLFALTLYNRSRVAIIQVKASPIPKDDDEMSVIKSLVINLGEMVKQNGNTNKAVVQMSNYLNTLSETHQKAISAIIDNVKDSTTATKQAIEDAAKSAITDRKTITDALSNQKQALDQIGDKMNVYQANDGEILNKLDEIMTTLEGLRSDITSSNTAFSHRIDAIEDDVKIVKKKITQEQPKTDAPIAAEIEIQEIDTDDKRNTESGTIDQSTTISGTAGTTSDTSTAGSKGTADNGEITITAKK